MVGQASLQSVRVKREPREIRSRLSSWPEHFIFFCTFCRRVNVAGGSYNTGTLHKQARYQSHFFLEIYVLLCARACVCVCVCVCDSFRLGVCVCKFLANTSKELDISTAKLLILTGFFVFFVCLLLFSFVCALVDHFTWKSYLFFLPFPAPFLRSTGCKSVCQFCFVFILFLFWLNLSWLRTPYIKAVWL